MFLGTVDHQQRFDDVTNDPRSSVINQFMATVIYNEAQHHTNRLRLNGQRLTCKPNKLGLEIMVKRQPKNCSNSSNSPGPIRYRLYVHYGVLRLVEPSSPVRITWSSVSANSHNAIQKKRTMIAIVHQKKSSQVLTAWAWLYRPCIWKPYIIIRASGNNLSP